MRIGFSVHKKFKKKIKYKKYRASIKRKYGMERNKKKLGKLFCVIKINNIDEILSPFFPEALSDLVFIHIFILHMANCNQPKFRNQNQMLLTHYVLPKLMMKR